MKISYLITRMDEFGGAQVHVRDLCLWMKAQGHDVSLLSGFSGKISDAMETQGIPFYEIADLQRSIHPLKDAKAFFQIRKALKIIRPDSLTCHSSKAGLLGRLAAWSLGIPSVFTAHGWAFTEGVPKTHRIIYKVLEKTAAFFGQQIITVSEYDRHLALKYKIAPSRKITAIHNGMPFLPPLQARHPTGKPVKILMVARVGAQKDHARLLRALWGCLDCDWTLDFVGGGDDLDLRNLARHMGMADRVRFLGERSDIPDLMEQADLFALISKWEGLPLTIIEAMRSALPVIATDVGGVAELINHRQTGILVPPESDDYLLKELRAILSDKEALIEMGYKGRLSYEQDFTFSTMAQKTLAVYERVISK
ncbi:MAG TPA: glycosyltransferase family 4 protein [Alphaproteobacteria bacterium]|nr:glycosyltransferase family 4 protein [Alphaproteobacteria bacterium]